MPMQKGRFLVGETALAERHIEVSGSSAVEGEVKREFQRLPGERDLEGTVGKTGRMVFHAYAQAKTMDGGNAPDNGQTEAAAGFFLSGGAEEAFSQTFDSLFRQTGTIVLHGKAALFQRYAYESAFRGVGRGVFEQIAQQHGKQGLVAFHGSAE